MRLLVITNKPNRASFRQRIGVHMPLLEKRGIRCDIARLPAGMEGRRRLFQRAKTFDAVFLQRKLLNLWDVFWLRRYCSRLFYDFDDAIMYRDHRPEKLCRGRQRRFGRTVAAADVVIAGNDYLASYARCYNASVHVLPTALDIGPYAIVRSPRVDGKKRLVWIGSRSTLKYLADLRRILEAVGRRHRGVVLRIIADAFFDLENMEVEKVVWSREREAASLLSCDIGLAPLPDNPFSRGKCGFKILQYQAAALPVVASPVGVNAQYVRPGVTGHYAETPDMWLRHLSELLEDREARESMGRAGRIDVEAFALGRIADCLGDIIEEGVNISGEEQRRKPVIQG